MRCVKHCAGHTLPPLREAGSGLNLMLVCFFVVFVVARNGFARPGVCVLALLFRAVDDEPSLPEVS
jgi:hypothetical protein